MQANIERYFLWLAIGVGVVLRLMHLGIPDLATDEAQFALGASAAQPPFGIGLFRMAQFILGTNVVSVRMVSVILGLCTLPLIYGIAYLICDNWKPSSGNREHAVALLATAIAAIFPSHILFSRLAYLSAPLFFAWALLLYTFLRARGEQSIRWLTALYAASVFATFTKTQGLLLPVLLLAGSMVEGRKSGDNFPAFAEAMAGRQCSNSNFHSIFNFQSSIGTSDQCGMNSALMGFDGKHRGLPPSPCRLRGASTPAANSCSEVPIVLFLGLMPITLYILTHPGITATVLLYGGDMYGLSNVLERLTTLIATWWRVLGLFLVAIIFSIRSIKTLQWPVLALLGIATFMGLVLGPGHGYYATHLVLFSLPIGIALTALRPVVRGITVVVLLLTTLTMLGPFPTPWSNPLFTENGFWNTNAPEINAAIGEEEAVTVLGSAGHHIRWYLHPRVLIGNAMDPPYPTDVVVLLGISEAGKVRGTVEHVTGHIAIVRQSAL